MAHDVVVLALHGMGDHDRTFDVALKDELAGRLDSSDWARVYYDQIFYQDVLQPNQRACWTRMKTRDVDWTTLRKFLLFGFSDAAGLERRANVTGSPYDQAQQRVLDALDRAYNFIGAAKPVVLIAHSLGGQVLSNYIWDAQRPNPRQGVWKGGGPPSSDPALTRFRRLKTLKFFYSTGCNIPIFVAGLPRNKIKAVKTSGAGYNFQWKNYYDADDVLGWPLKPLSTSYRGALTVDKQVNAGGGVLGTLAKSGNPFSHGQYWTDGDVLRPLVRDIRSLLP